MSFYIALFDTSNLQFKSTTYRYNKALLFFYEKSVDVGFQQFSIHYDKRGFRAILFFGIVTSIILFFVDLWQFYDLRHALIYRGAITFFLGAMLLPTYHSYLDKPKFFQLFVLFACAVNGMAMFFRFHYMEESPYFLANSLTSLLFIMSTVIGLRYRYSVWLNIAVVVAYCVYIYFFNYILVAAELVPYLIFILCIAILASYILEVGKIKLYVNGRRLRQEINKVEGLNVVKNKLFSIVSHDLRSPIATLKGVLSLFRQEALTMEELKTVAKDTEQNLNNTSDLIENLLAWSKSQLEGIEVKPSIFSLNQYLRKILNLYRATMAHKAIQLIYKEDDELKVVADKEMMHIAIRNLISNAVKFTPHDGEIEVALKKRGEYAEVRVTDSGIGIETGKLDKLFTISKDTVIGSAEAAGAGLGLVLVKEFIELNSGSVSVESKVGSGSTFTLKIPLAS